SSFNTDPVDKSNSSNASRASTPVQWTGSPAVGCSSKTATPTPAWASFSAAYSPAGPPPTTMAAIEDIKYEIRPDYRGRKYAESGSEFLLPCFPGSSYGDPERKQDQPQVKHH